MTEATRTLVLKFGGSAFAADVLKPFAERVRALVRGGARVVIVHGGGKEITNLLDRIGKKSTFIDGLRFTDEETLDVVEMVLSGRVNKAIVRGLLSVGVHSAGLSGTDGALLMARPLVVEKEVSPGQLQRVDYGLVGEITEVNPNLLKVLLAAGYVPVVSPLALTAQGGLLNVNADTSAARIAGALGADAFWLLTDVPGVLVPGAAGSAPVPELTASAAISLKQQGIVTGGMIPKVDACLEAVRRGAGSARIASLADFLKSDAPTGTRISGE